MTGRGDDEVRAGLRANLGRLWRYALVLAARRDTAEDLVQATCLRALERAHLFVPGTRCDAWLMTILHGLWINELRARRVRTGAGTVEADIALVHDGAAAMELRLQAGDVLRAAATLPDGQRAALFLVYAEGLSYREAAQILDVPVGTVMSRLAAARLALGRQVGEDGPAAVRGKEAAP